MKFIITQNQYKLLLEQKSDYAMDRQSNAIANALGTRSDKDYKDVEEVIKKTSSDFNNMTIDDMIDIISGLLDGIPGLGNLASAIIDIAHTISYIIRLFLTDDTLKKIEYGAMAIATFAATFIPFAGNAANMLTRQGIKKLVSMTPPKIFQIAKKLGLINKIPITFVKSSWRYNLLLVLLKMETREHLENIFVELIQKLYIVSKSNRLPSDINYHINNFIVMLGEYRKELPNAELILKEIEKEQN